VCRQFGLWGADAEDFAQDARLKLVENDCERLRSFQGRSDIKTYLVVILRNQACDHQTARCGRWRPTAAVRRAGPQAVRFQQLVARDGMTIADALSTVEREFGPVDRAALEALAADFRVRPRRQPAEDEMLDHVPAPEPNAEEAMIIEERRAKQARLYARVLELIATLEPADRLIIQLRYLEGRKVSTIASILQRDQKRLYREIPELVAQLRRTLESEGFDVDDLFGDEP
jgi:RNA polymerase sigma factor (sigma-70 family)